MTAPVNGKPAESVTLAALANAKGIPASVLKHFGLTDGPDAVHIPYRDEGGRVVFHRKRTALRAKNGTKQPNGVKLQPYGMDRLGQARALDYLVLVEGESDCWTLWHHDVPALGFPGAGTSSCLKADHLAGIGRLYVHREPEQSGDTFVRGLADQLARLKYQGDILVLTMPDGIKDPADLHAKDPAGFEDRWRERIGQAKPLTKQQPARSEPWGKPVELTALPAVEPFPLEVLPSGLQKLAQEISWAMNVPPDHPALCAITLASGAIGNSRVLSFSSTHQKSASLYVVFCAPPGKRKTPPLALLRKPLDKIQWRYLDQYKKEVEEWKSRDKEGRGPKPTLRQALVQDVTCETLVSYLADNPRGLMMIRGELSSLFYGLNQYKGGAGNDRQFFLALWDNEPWSAGRKSDQSRDGAPIYVRRPFCSILGTIQPEVLRALHGPSRHGPRVDDGFVDRFLVSYPDVLPEVGEQGREVGRVHLDDWDQAITDLVDRLDMDADEDGHERPFRLSLDREAFEEWKGFTARHAVEVNDPDFPDYLQGPWSKLRDYCGRFALVLQLLRHAYRETPVNGAIEGPGMAGAVALVDYFKSHHRRSHACMNSDRRVAQAEKILRWIRRERRSEFKRWEPYRDLKSDSCFPTPDSLDPAIGVLEGCGMIRPADQDDRRRPGRQPATAYLENPTVLQELMVQLV